MPTTLSPAPDAPAASRRTNPTELTLDPSDWSALRALGHRMLDDTLDRLEHVRDEPAWRPLPDTLRRSLRQPLPRNRPQRNLGPLIQLTSDHRSPRVTGETRCTVHEGKTVMEPRARLAAMSGTRNSRSPPS